MEFSSLPTVDVLYDFDMKGSGIRSVWLSSQQLQKCEECVAVLRMFRD
jgi:hypothetical protein